MDNQTLPPEILEQFKQLPPAVQESLMESNWEEETRKIVSKYNLRVDQGAYVETETMLIMFGFVSPEDFVSDLIKDTEMSEEIAKQIEADISQNIFKKIMDMVREKSKSNDIKFSPLNDSGAGPLPGSFDNSIHDHLPNKAPIDEIKIASQKSSDPILNERLNNTTVQRPRTIDPYLEPVE